MAIVIDVLFLLMLPSQGSCPSRDHVGAIHGLTVLSKNIQGNFLQIVNVQWKSRMLSGSFRSLCWWLIWGKEACSSARNQRIWRWWEGSELQEADTWYVGKPWRRATPTFLTCWRPKPCPKNRLCLFFDSVLHVLSNSSESTPLYFSDNLFSSSSIWAEASDLNPSL